MDKRQKGKAEEEVSPEVLSDDGDLSVCEKASSPEIARSQDKDEPCKDGVG